jgi:hypothetical protein
MHTKTRKVEAAAEGQLATDLTMDCSKRVCLAPEGMSSPKLSLYEQIFFAAIGGDWSAFDHTTCELVSLKTAERNYRRRQRDECAVLQGIACGRLQLQAMDAQILTRILLRMTLRMRAVPPECHLTPVTAKENHHD